MSGRINQLTDRIDELVLESLPNTWKELNSKLVQAAEEIYPVRPRIHHAAEHWKERQILSDLPLSLRIYADLEPGFKMRVCFKLWRKWAQLRRHTRNTKNISKRRRSSSWTTPSQAHCRRVSWMEAMHCTRSSKNSKSGGVLREYSLGTHRAEAGGRRGNAT